MIDTIQISQQDEILRSALAQGLDLKDYGKAIEGELSKTEWDAIGDCILCTVEF
jgi:hypothetical protein